MDSQPSEDDEISVSSTSSASTPSPTQPPSHSVFDEDSRFAAPSPISSPVNSPPSSPLKQPTKRRKLYTFAGGQVPFSEKYWPQEGDDAGSFSGHDLDDVYSGLENNQEDNSSLHADLDLDKNECASNDAELSNPEAAVCAVTGGENSADSSQSDKNDSDNSSSLASGPSTPGQASCFSSSESEAEEQEEVVHYGSLPVSKGSTLTIDEGVILVMDLYIKDKLKKGTVENILKLVQRFVSEDNLMLSSKHSIFKYVESLAPPLREKVYYYCKDCLYYFGETDSICKLCPCKQSNKFYQLSLIDQIRNLFECHNLADIIDKYSEQRTENNGVSDIRDGSEYKRARLPGKYDLVLMGHTDGVSVSESSNLSMWPLEFVICEIPFNLRYKFVLIAGIWMDSCKPSMATYMKPFLEELKELFISGVHWVHPKTKKRECSRIVVPCFCADAPARALLQQILSHGGRFCCHICEQKMVKLPAVPAQPGIKKEKRKRVFSFLEDDSTLRTKERMQAQTKSAVEYRKVTGKVQDVKGVTGKSIVSELPNCDRSTFVYPEYMHILINILKLFFELWFDISGEWSLKEYRDQIDKFLEDIKVPDFLTRIPRSTQSYSKWKANELRSFLLFFSLVILKKFMAEKYFQHWILFVGGIFLLLEDFVSENNIKKAELLLRMFLRDFDSLYRQKSFTYNLHCLLHLALTVRRWGPLGRTSAFPFENFNGILSSCIHGKKNLAKELSNTIRTIQGVEILKARTLLIAPQNDREESKLLFCNPVRDFVFTVEQNDMLQQEKLCPPYCVYSRLKTGKGIYTTLSYKRQLKRNNYTVCIDFKERKQYGEIMYFLEDKSGVKRAFVKIFVIEHERTFCHSDSRHVVKHIIPIKESNGIVLVPVDAIQFKVIRVEDYVCLRPNRYEYNL